MNGHVNGSDLSARAEHHQVAESALKVESESDDGICYAPFRCVFSAWSPLLRSPLPRRQATKSISSNSSAISINVESVRQALPLGEVGIFDEKVLAQIRI
jgi:hypothetical protein